MRTFYSGAATSAIRPWRPRSTSTFLRWMRRTNAHSVSAPNRRASRITRRGAIGPLASRTPRATLGGWRPTNRRSEVIMESQNAQAIAEPPGLALYRIGIGHYFSRSLALAAKLGVADFMKDGPRHYDDLAK